MARVLVIEDNPVNLELMCCVLQAWQHEALTAVDGAQGLVMAHAEKPDLIICDVELPNMDGLAVARALRADPSLRHTPLMAVTGLARASDKAMALAAGFDAVFSKPFAPSELMRELELLLPGAAATGRPVGFAPARPEDTASGRMPIPAHLRAPWAPCVLLTVDDGPRNLEYKHELLEPAGYTVLDADGVASALEVLRRGSIDLVLSDVMMLDGGGFELLRLVRAEVAWQDLPFVFLTSTARDSASRVHGLELGAQDFLVRPLEAFDLLASIRRALGKP